MTKPKGHKKGGMPKLVPTPKINDSPPKEPIHVNLKYDPEIKDVVDRLEISKKAIAAFANDPVLFFEKALQCYDGVGFYPLWDGEREILNALPRAVETHRPVYIASGHALGKDFISGGIPLWWQSTRYPAKTIMTAPTERQALEITWNELERHIARYNPKLIPLKGKVIKGKIEWDPEHFILCFTTSASDTLVGKAQGFHSPNMCIIVTEAQAIDDKIKEQLDGITTSGNVLFIAIGNPLVTTGWFARGLRDSINNIVIHLDCEKSPNVLSGKDIIPGLCSKAWVDEKRREWFNEDPNHPLWLAKVKGQLPVSTIENVFTYDILSRNRTMVSGVEGVSIGIDVAAFGDDESVFWIIDSGKPKEMISTAKHEPTDTAGRGYQLKAKHDADIICIDADGLGEGVASMLREMCKDHCRILAIHGNERPANHNSQYFNKRAEMWFVVRNMLMEGMLRGPMDQATKDELCEVKYFYNSKGKLQLEKKDEVKDRLGRSPDRADAFIYAAYGLSYLTGSPKVRSIWDDDTPRLPARRSFMSA